MSDLKGVLLCVGLGIFAAVLIAGCAGGDTLSKEQYVSRLNAMCDDFAEREKEIGDPQTLADLAERGPRIVAAFEEAISDKVGNLKAPDEIAPEAERMARLADEQRKVLGELVDAAKGNDFARVDELASRNAALNRQARSTARALGADACAGD